MAAFYQNIIILCSIFALKIQSNNGFVLPEKRVSPAKSGFPFSNPLEFKQSRKILTVPKTQTSSNGEGNVKSLSKQSLGSPICNYHTITIPSTKPGPPCQAINVEDLTQTIKSLLAESSMKQGVINIISRHTTTAITINERESRLAQDMEKYFLSLAPPDERSSAETATKDVRYFHNDIDLRPDSLEEAQQCRENGWEIDDPKQLEAWRNQEPINAHSHLLSMLLGSSESIPVVDGEMVIGQWQSILLVDLDGPRERTVGVQFLGYH